jgi:hypothetical protein
MTIGGSIALIVLGAILAFAVEFDVQGVNIDAIGYILMIGGLVGLIFGLIWWQRGSRVVTTREPAVEERRRVIDREY